MNLPDLSSLGRRTNVVLLQTPSDALRLFVQDKISGIFNCDQNSIKKIVKKDLPEVKNMVNILPFNAQKWFFIVNLEDLGKTGKKELLKIIDMNSTGVFLCISDKYPTYKWFKKTLDDSEGFIDLYIAYLNKANMLYLYDNIVPEENKLKHSLYQYVQSSYSKDVSEVITLFKELSIGTEINSRKDITAVCGLGGNTIDSFVFSLLKPPPNTERGTRTIFKNRSQSGLDLAEDYGWNKLWAFSLGTVRAFCDIKMLYISGTVYKSLRDIPEGYDAKKLGRHSRHLFRIKEIPLSRLIRLRYLLEQSRWNSEMDFLGFLYEYYKELIIEEGVV